MIFIFYFISKYSSFINNNHYFFNVKRLLDIKFKFNVYNFYMNDVYFFYIETSFIILI